MNDHIDARPSAVLFRTIEGDVGVIDCSSSPVRAVSWIEGGCVPQLAAGGGTEATPNDHFAAGPKRGVFVAIGGRSSARIGVGPIGGSWIVHAMVEHGSAAEGLPCIASRIVDCSGGKRGSSAIIAPSIHAIISPGGTVAETCGRSSGSDHRRARIRRGIETGASCIKRRRFIPNTENGNLRSISNCSRLLARCGSGSRRGGGYAIYVEQIVKHVVGAGVAAVPKISPVY